MPRRVKHPFLVSRAREGGPAASRFDPGGAGVELWGRLRHDPIETAGRPGLRRALSPTFPAGEMVFFIPWRVVAEESGAAHFGFGGAMLLDLLGPMVRLPAALSISTLVIFRSGATMELGRSERTSHGVDAANTPDRKPR
jgi:hypothetical protein